jgi:penicillin-binding protein 1C
MKILKAAAASLAVAASLFLAFLALVPRFSKPLSTAIYDRDGTLLGAAVAADGQWRLEPGPVPDRVARAIECFEDRRFLIHPGVDPIALARAVVQNISGGRIVSGGSTLTMQTVRLSRNNPDRTFAEKMREAALSLVLEARYTKKEILALYAANAPFGGNIVGIEAASWRYWGRPPESLDWAEAATLAVLPNQPTLVHPGADRDRLLDKRNRLLRALAKEGRIDQELLDLSLKEPLPDKPYPLPRLAPHYLARYASGGHITTTIDRKLQASVTQTLERWSADFDARGIHNAAAIVIDTATGDVLAYAGNTGSGREESHNADVDIITSRRSSGSVLKPFLFASMLDAGLLLPNQLVVDIPTRVGSYMPENNVPVYQGVVPAREALSRSLNIPAVRELREYGIAPFLDRLREIGFTTFTRTADDYGLPLILGGGEVTLEETARAYAALMRRADPDGCGAKRPDRDSGGFPESPFSVGAAWLTLDALVDGTRPNDEELWRSFASGRNIAWKTGTSYGNRDGWAIGTTPRYTVGVWAGNATGEGRPELKSVTTSAPVLFDIFSRLPMTDWPARPEMELREVTVCAESGYLAGSDCARTTKAWKPAAAPDGSPCPYCRSVSLTADGKWQATANDLTGAEAGTLPLVEKRFVLPPTIEYWYRRHAFDYHPLPPWVAGHSGDSAKAELAIVFPESNAHVFIPTEIDGKSGALVMQATHRDPRETLYWDIDGEYLGQTRDYHRMSVRPSPGTHVLTVTDSSGTRATRKFEILSEDAPL